MVGTSKPAGQRIEAELLADVYAPVEEPRLPASHHGFVSPALEVTDDGAQPGTTRPDAGSPDEAAQQALLRDIDAILGRLEIGIAAHRRGMGALLERLASPAA